MIEMVLQKLEEKMMMVLAEVEGLRSDVQRLSQENAALKYERENNKNRLQDLIALLDTINNDDQMIPTTNVVAMESVLFQDQN